jgi:hypothetical protein
MSMARLAICVKLQEHQDNMLGIGAPALRNQNILKNG